MGKGIGQFFAAIIGSILPLAVLCAVGYFELPKLYARWQAGEAAIALVPELRSTIAYDAQALADEKAQCKRSAARTDANRALIAKFASITPGQGADHLGQADIEDLLK